LAIARRHALWLSGTVVGAAAGDDVPLEDVVEDVELVDEEPPGAGAEAVHPAAGSASRPAHVRSVRLENRARLIFRPPR
jgi:hypothetical protein